MKFTELDLHDDLMKGIKEAGFIECMPVQEATYLHAFQGKDVSVQSQTGTGKSAAFLVSIMQVFMKEPEKKQKALIVAPTRELAVQIEKEAHLLGKYLPLKIGVFYGGVGYNTQEKLLRDGVDIIIGTPGRLIDFTMSGKLSLRDLSVFVIDEADRLFDMGFLPDIKKLFRKMPDQSQRQTMLFSATLDTRVKNIAHEFMNDPVEIEIEPEQVTVENIFQKLYHVGKKEKMSLLLGILKKTNPANGIIFTNTKHRAVEVAETLKRNGFNATYIIGDLPQSKRLQVIESVKKGTLPFLVATDVAARGLHINDLELVINYDLPENCENYVHRIGRTARVGKSGTAISLVCEEFVWGLEAIESYTNVKIESDVADEELYEKNYIVPPKERRDSRGRPQRSQGARQERGGGGRKGPGQRSGGRSYERAAEGEGGKKQHPAEKRKSQKAPRQGAAAAQNREAQEQRGQRPASKKRKPQQNQQQHQRSQNSKNRRPGKQNRPAAAEAPRNTAAPQPVQQAPKKSIAKKVMGFFSRKGKKDQN
ncbi:MAG TPA: DEAD/DEAH box helicase [Spirochaetota bacterium]|nr:DEAD/DEAH box helicase [Spirochaetota bacterium]